jgi:hypothetical protein
MRTPTPWSWKRLVSPRRRFAAALLLAHGAASIYPLLALPCAALAQGEPAAKPDQKQADRRARQLFEQGKVAFSEGNYRDAWEHFREAYLLSKRPELLYNVGQSADRMRMDREALTAFKLYLQKLPQAENRKEVEARIVWLEERLAREANGGEVNPTTLDDSTDDELGSPASSGAEAGGEGADGAEGEEGQGSPETLSDGADEQEDEADAAPANANGQPERTGWYFRGALGLGVLADGLSDSTADSLGSLTLSGLLAAGYDVSKGVVIGGGVTFDGGLAPSVKIGETSQRIDTANLGMLIAFVDYYLAPRKHGWHLLGGVGFGSLALTDKSASVGIEDATGGSLLLGGGLEWPLDRDWGIGALARITLSRLSTDTATHTAASPSIAFTGVWY